MSNKLPIFCLINGRTTFKAFSIELEATKTVSQLQKSIKNEHPGVFDHIPTEDICLWRVYIPVCDDEDSADIDIHSLTEKKAVGATTRLSKLFPEGVEDNAIHIVVELPNSVSSKAQAIHMLKVFVKTRPQQSFVWDANCSTSTLQELEDVIYSTFPDLQNGHANIAIHDPISAGRNIPVVHYPSNDQELRTIIQDYARGGIMDVIVDLETPTANLSDYNLAEVNKMFTLAPTKDPTVQDIYHFKGLGVATLDSDERKLALDRLYQDIQTKQELVAPNTNEGMSAFINSYIIHASHLFKDRLTLSWEDSTMGPRGHGTIDLTIKSKDCPTHTLGIVTKSTRDNFDKGTAKTIMQLNSLSNRKRKFEDDDNYDPVTSDTMSYGIVTDARSWCFVQCKTVSSTSTTPIAPIFSACIAPGAVTYDSDDWRKDVKEIFAKIVWILEHLLQQRPNAKKRHKIENIE